MRIIWVGTFLAGLAMPSYARADDAVFKSYVMSLFSEPGKALSEFQTLAATSPLLTSYALAIFTETRCATPKPSASLIKAAGGESAFETEVGKKVFAVAGVVATMTYPTPEDEAGFCDAARRVIAVGEETAASQ